jgi:L-amino acid N-acyltransferase YncA
MAVPVLKMTRIQLKTAETGGWRMQDQKDEVAPIENSVAVNSPSSEEEVTFSIRRGEMNDLGQIVNLWFQGQSNSLNLDRNFVERFYLTRLQNQNERFGFWVAEADDLKGGGRSDSRILGWQSLLPCRVNPIVHGEWAESSTYVRQNIRAHGVGRALLTHVTQGAGISGLKKIVAFVRSDNPAIQRIVDGLNWTKVGSVPGDYDGDPNRLYYVFSVPASRQDEASYQAGR